MNQDMIENPERLCVDIRGTFNKNSAAPIIFQRSRGTLQKKTGPIIPFNPQTRTQQLNRILFRAAVNITLQLTDAQKQLYRDRIVMKKPGMTWRLQAIKEFLKPNRFNALRFNEGYFFGGKPQRDAWRFNEIALDDGFLGSEETLPLHRQAIENLFPNIDLSSIFPQPE